MSELVVGSIAGLASNSYVVDIASGSTLDVTNATGTLPSAQLPTGSVLQVVQEVKTDIFTTTSTSFTDVTGVSASITPTTADSKILVMVNSALGNSASTSMFQLRRDSTDIGVSTGHTYNQTAVSYAAGNHFINGAIIYLDSPATTSSVTYSLRAKVFSGTCYVGGDASNGGITTITLMEVAG